MNPKIEKSGYRTAFLQGNPSRQKRQKALDSFPYSILKIPVSMDIAAPGIDMFVISHVINSDFAWTFRHPVDVSNDASAFITKGLPQGTRYKGVI
jgi:superfamily II DNA/RNA helicase